MSFCRFLQSFNQFQYPGQRWEFGIVVEDDIPIRIGFGKGFPQLLHNPLRGWMKSDVIVQDFAPRMLDHEKAIQEPEGQRRYGEEVKGDDRFSMMLM
jgi:hypothetical protein